jgi:hypothetical protein
MSERIKMTVEMEVTPAQGLALQAMFEDWNTLSSMGGSRSAGFYADGDGNFHPNCKITFDGEVPELTDELRKIAVVEDQGGNRVYDFDPIAWKIEPG